jgi:hypothetical protein
MEDKEIAAKILKECGLFDSDVNSSPQTLVTLSKEIVVGLKSALKDNQGELFDFLDELKTLSDIHVKQASALSEQQQKYLKTLGVDSISDVRNALKRSKKLIESYEHFVDGVETLTKKTK